MEEKVIDIEELAQDGHNFNKGNDEGQLLMERSFKELGAGRSILLDRNGNIIAGNKSQKAAIAAGIKRVRVVETTGDVRAPFTQGGGLRLRHRCMILFLLEHEFHELTRIYKEL